MKKITVKDLFDLFSKEYVDDCIYVFFYESNDEVHAIHICHTDEIPQNFNNRIIQQIDFTYDGNINILLK